MVRAGYECEDCGATDWDTVLHAHHLEPVGEAGYGPGCQHHPENLRVLCQACHAMAHERLRAKPGTQLRLLAA